jgi:hypothetical protein
MTEKTASDSPTRHTGRCGTAAKHHLTAGTAEGGPCYGPSAPHPSQALCSFLLHFNSVAAGSADLQAGAELFLHPYLFAIDTEAKHKTREADGQSNTKERKWKW